MPRREMSAGGMADTQRPVTSPNTAEVTIRGQKLERLPRQGQDQIICEDNLH